MKYNQEEDQISARASRKPNHFSGPGNMLGFPSPLMCPVSHRNRDTAEDPMSEIRLEAAHTASLSHTFQARWQVYKSIKQTSQTYTVFTELNHNFVKRSATVLKLVLITGQTSRCQS